MTVSLPKPNWRSLQDARERTSTALAGRLNAFKSRRGPTDAAAAQEWSSVMTAPARPVSAKDRRITAAAGTASATSTALDQPKESRRKRSGDASEVSTAWVLPGLVLVLCLTSVGWFFSSGTAAAAWLIALVAIAFVGAPITLLALRLMGFEDRD
jgi:Flp pilus assembly protein TadB